MKLPRDISGDDLVKRLGMFGYVLTRQAGSHMRMTTQRNGQHHVTIPRHDPVKVGTLNAILSSVAGHLQMTREALAEALFT